MNYTKRRAKMQTRYSKESYLGEIVSQNAEGGLINSFDVHLVHENVTVRKVPNASPIQFAVGEKVTLTRLGRLEWQISGKSYMG